MDALTIVVAAMLGFAWGLIAGVMALYLTGENEAEMDRDWRVKPPPPPRPRAVKRLEYHAGVDPGPPPRWR